MLVIKCGEEDKSLTCLLNAFDRIRSDSAHKVWMNWIRSASASAFALWTIRSRYLELMNRRDRRPSRHILGHDGTATENLATTRLSSVVYKLYKMASTGHGWTRVVLTKPVAQSWLKVSIVCFATMQKRACAMHISRMWSSIMIWL
jgi:hypothetical protein